MYLIGYHIITQLTQYESLNFDLLCSSRMIELKCYISSLVGKSSETNSTILEITTSTFMSSLTDVS